MRILITGIAGHIGSQLAAWIRAAHPEAEIIGIDNLSSGYWENVPDGVAMAQADVGSPETNLLFAHRFDAVYHFAAYAAECLSPFVRRFNYANNLLATASLINQVLGGAGCGRFVFASSIAVYGEGIPPFDEKTPCLPYDPYGVAKLAAEHDLRIAGRQHGLDFCILRLFNCYGPGQSLWQPYRNVLGIWMRAALEGRPLGIFGDGNQTRAFTFLEDILPAMFDAGLGPLPSSRRTFNLGNEYASRINDLAALVSAITGAPVEYLPARHEVAQAVADCSRAKRLFGYDALTTPSHGVARMWAWAKEAWAKYPERRQAQEPPIELFRGLPAAWDKRPFPYLDKPSGLWTPEHEGGLLLRPPAVR